MRVISLFDGIACAYCALNALGIVPDVYEASEVDANAMACARFNWPDIRHVGDVTTYRPDGPCDLLIGGSPCQDLSVANRYRAGLGGTRSGLFRHYVRVLRRVKPRYFILENVVSMPPEARDEITRMLEVEPIEIDSALVTAQSRRRLYWTNIEVVTQPKDRGLLFPDVLEHGYTPRTDKAVTLTLKIPHRQSSMIRRAMVHKSFENTIWYSKGVYRFWECEIRDREYTSKQQAIWNALTLTRDPRYTPLGHRSLTPLEAERLQGLPAKYTRVLTPRQALEAIGNGFTVPIIGHILSFAAF